MLIWDQVAANRRRTWLLMIAFVVLVTAFAGLAGVVLTGTIAAVPFAAAIALTYALFSYYASSSITLGISGAHAVTKQDEPALWLAVENLCIGAGLPMPQVHVIEDSAPNAFATGRDPAHSHVVVTRGLLDKLDRLELEGVIAHELSHIGNHDIRVMTITVVLLGVVALLSDLLLRWTWWGSGRRSGSRDKGGAAFAILVILAVVAAILAPLISRLMHLAISRRREYLADASGALLTRYPEGLARALEKIAADREPLEAANKATEHLYISNPLKNHESLLNRLFDTHPPIEDRVRILRSM